MLGQASLATVITVFTADQCVNMEARAHELANNDKGLNKALSDRHQWALCPYKGKAEEIFSLRVEDEDGTPLYTVPTDPFDEALQARLVLQFKSTGVTILRQLVSATLFDQLAQRDGGDPRRIMADLKMRSGLSDMKRICGQMDAIFHAIRQGPSEPSADFIVRLNAHLTRERHLGYERGVEKFTEKVATSHNTSDAAYAWETMAKVMSFDDLVFEAHVRIARAAEMKQHAVCAVAAAVTSETLSAGSRPRHCDLSCKGVAQCQPNKANRKCARATRALCAAMSLGTIPRTRPE